MKWLSLVALLLAVLPAPGRAQALVSQDYPLVWGAIERLYPGSGRVLVRTDDDHLYEIRARDARIQLTGGDAGRWNDLQVGQGVDVFGSRGSGDIVDASLVRITGLYDPKRRSSIRDPDPQYRYSSDRYQDDRFVDVVGTVTSLDPVRESFRLRTSRGLRSVEAFDETRWYLDSGRQADFRDVQVGDDLRVRGAEHSGRIVADEVTLLGPPLGWSGSAGRSADRDPRGEAVVVGTVRAPTYELDRRIKIRSSQGDLSIDVDRHTPIYKYDDRISIHELERGDRIRVVGTWVGPDRIRARRIAVEVPPRGRQATRGYRSTLPPAPMPMVRAIGTLVSFDDERNRMRLSTRAGDRIVIANGTPAYVRDERMSRRDLRQGDRVRAVGYWNGREILATRLELAN